MEIKIVNKSNNELPYYATEHASGMDLKAFLKESIKLLPFERKLIPTGIHIELPIGFEAQIRPRSGLAIKKGITVLNSPGTIDADFRGEICIILINLSQETVVIENGERIAQMIISKYEKIDQLIELYEVDDLSNTNRGSGGFGHTGIL